MHSVSFICVDSQFSNSSESKKFYGETSTGRHFLVKNLKISPSFIEQSTFRGEEKGKVPRKGEEEGWPAKGAKGKKAARKQVKESLVTLSLRLPFWRVPRGYFQVWVPVLKNFVFWLFLFWDWVHQGIAIASGFLESLANS